ncbi:6538_t:CDS:2 [Dentiscutata erythropus]|uniref:6538_t:CDS:1 n=1 Tax=Dentiscutata erythropus TaxID=1348616 RepID=A0A9N9JRS7_9GLOM|nr:6538_t:CDS:2 [Dentiscutata erythropus]
MKNLQKPLDVSISTIKCNDWDKNQVATGLKLEAIDLKFEYEDRETTDVAIVDRVLFHQKPHKIIFICEDSQQQFCFQKLGSNEDLDFTRKLSSKKDNILEVSLDPCEDEKIFKVKYEELHIFSMSEGIGYFLN